MDEYSSRFNNQEYNMNLYEYKPSNGKVEYYRKVEKTITKTTSNINNGRSKQYTSFTNKSYSRGNEIEKENEYERGNSFALYQRGGETKGNRSFSSKQKFSYSGRIREKNNYVYYVSGVGYVNKDGETKPQEKKVNKPKSKPQSIQRPETIVIKSKKDEDTGERELVDNYQYHETKDLKRENKKTLVTHRRLCEPFYQSVSRRSKKKYSSYTEKPRIHQISSSFRREEYEVAEPKRTIQREIKSKFNYRTQKIPGDKYNYFSSKQGSNSVKHYNSNSYISNSTYGNESISNTGLYKRRDVAEGKKITIPTGSTNKYKIIYEKRNYEEKRKNDYNNVYSNIKRHEIKVSFKENKNSNNIQNYKNKFVEKSKVNNNIIKKNIYTSKTQNISEEIQRKYGQKIGRQRKQIHQENKKYYPSQISQQKVEINQKKITQNIPHHVQQIAVYERGQKSQTQSNIPQLVQQIEINERVLSQNIPQHVQQIEVYEENGESNAPPNIQVVQTVENYKEKQENIQQVQQENEEVEQVQQDNEAVEQAQQENEEVEHLEEDNQEVEENIEQINQENVEIEHEEQENHENLEKINQENGDAEQVEEENHDNMEEQHQENEEVEQEEEIQENMEQINQEEMEQNDEEEYGENMDIQHEQNIQVQQERHEDNKEINPEQVKTNIISQQNVQQDNEAKQYEKEENEEEQDNVEQVEEEEEVQEEKEVIEEEHEQQGEEFNQQENEEIIEEEEIIQQNKGINEKQNKGMENQKQIQKNQEIFQQNQTQFIPQQINQKAQEIYQDKKSIINNKENKQNYQDKFQKIKNQFFSDENIQENEEIYQDEGIEIMPEDNMRRRKKNYQQKNMQYFPQQNIEYNQNIYQIENRQYIPQANNRQLIQKIYNEERREIIPQEKDIQKEEIYNEERRVYMPQQKLNQNEQQIYQEEINQYIPQQNIQKTKEIYQEERRQYIPIRNIQQEKQRYQEEIRQYIPMTNMNQRQEVYHEEKRQYSQQINNNNQNQIYYGQDFCPIHGMRNQRIGNNHQFEIQRQIRQSGNRNEPPRRQEVFHTHQEMNEIIGETNNYKFYESKNIRNNDESAKFVTLHYTRGVDEKEDNKKRGPSFSNFYIATKNIPISTEANFQQFASFNQNISSNNNNFDGHSHIHSQNGFCPLHRNNMISFMQQKGN